MPHQQPSEPGPEYDMALLVREAKNLSELEDLDFALVASGAVETISILSLRLRSYFGNK